VGLSGDSATDRELLRSVAREMARDGVDIERGPLVRLVSLCDGEQAQLVLLVTDHLVFDGQSLGPLQSDLEAAYAGRILAPTKQGYADFARSQQDLLTGDYGRRAQAFWSSRFERFEAYPPRFHLADKLPSEQAAATLRIARRVPLELRTRLQRRAAELGVGVFVLAASAVLRAAARAGRAPSGLVTDVHGRITPAAMDLVGLFSHGMPIYCDPKHFHDCSETVQCISSELANAMDHAMPLRRLSEEYKRRCSGYEGGLEPFLYFAEARGWDRPLKLGDALLQPLRVYGPHDIRPGKGVDMLSIQLEHDDASAWLTAQASPTVNPPQRLEEFLDCCIEELACFSV